MGLFIFQNYTNRTLWDFYTWEEFEKGLVEDLEKKKSKPLKIQRSSLKIWRKNKFEDSKEEQVQRFKGRTSLKIWKIKFEN